MFLDLPTLFEALRTALFRKRNSLRSFGFQFLSLLLLLVFHTIARTGQVLDRKVFGGHRTQEIGAPIYIIANPRSGTTFLHRLMSVDDQFTTFKLINTLLPAIVFYKLLAGLAAVDQKLGSPMIRTLNWINEKGFRGWQGIHQTRLQEPEEDEQLFLYTLLSPSLLMFFPFPEELHRIRFVDNLDEEVRHRLMAYYKGCLRRHCYATGPGKTLLAKNVLIHGRLRSILQAVPDMRIVHLIRHPYESIPSFINMYAVFWSSTYPPGFADIEAFRGLARLLCDYYSYLLEIKRRIPADRFIEVRYEDLVAEPMQVLDRIYKTFNMNMSDEFKRRAEAETQKARDYSSTHRYSLEQFGLKREWLYGELKEVFDEYGFEP